MIGKIVVRERMVIRRGSGELSVRLGETSNLLDANKSRDVIDAPSEGQRGVGSGGVGTW